MLFGVIAVYLLLAVSLRVEVSYSLLMPEKQSVFELRIAGVRVRRRREKRNKEKKSRKRMNKTLSILRRAAKIERIDARAHVGTGDAMSTALATGGVRAALCAELGPLCALEKTSVVVQPDFSRKCFAFELVCIFSVSLGDIMLSAAKAAGKGKNRAEKAQCRNEKRKEGWRWNGIPLKI